VEGKEAKGEKLATGSAMAPVRGAPGTGGGGVKACVETEGVERCWYGSWKFSYW